MANAANSPFVKHPALLALFAPRPPPTFKAPMPTKPMGKLTGIAQFTSEFGKESDAASPKKYETPTQRKIRVIKEKKERHLQILADREKQWDPHNNANATKDPYKTLFVARLSYELTEDDLRREFERYGRIHCVKLITDKNTDKSRGYAFIEFERSNDLKEAFQHADGHKLKGRRILVDVERGRTVKTWKPRKLGGGLGKTRAGPNTNGPHKLGVMPHNNRHSVRANNKISGRDMRRNDRSNKKADKYSNRRDKYRDRDYRDRDRRPRGDRDRKEAARNERDHRRKRSRSRSRDKKRESKRIKKENNKYDKGQVHNGRNTKDNRERDRRRRRSRSKEKNRERRR